MSAKITEFQGVIAKSSRALLGALFIAGFAAGCGGVAAGAPSLASDLTVVASGALPQSRVLFRLSGVDHVSRPVDLAITDLSVRVRSTGRTRTLEALDFTLGDLDVPAGAMPPAGVQLRDMHLGIREPAQLTLTAAEDDHLALHARLPMRASWSLELADGTRYPFGALQTEPLELDLHVLAGLPGQPDTLVVDSTCRDACWSIADVASLENGSMYGAAAAVVSPL